MYNILRSGKNRIAAKFSGYKKKYLLKEKIMYNQVRNKFFFSSFFKSLINLITFTKFSRSKISRFLLSTTFKKVCYPKHAKKASTLKLLRETSPRFKVFSYYARKKKLGELHFSPRKFALLFPLRRIIMCKAVGEGFFRKLKKGFLKFKIFRKKYLKTAKINFFFYFFFTNIAVFKSYKLRFKPDSVKLLYRKKKLIFFSKKNFLLF